MLLSARDPSAPEEQWASTAQHRDRCSPLQIFINRFIRLEAQSEPRRRKPTQTQKPAKTEVGGVPGVCAQATVVRWQAWEREG